MERVPCAISPWRMRSVPLHLLLNIHHWVELLTVAMTFGAPRQMASLGELLVDASRSGNVVALDGLLQEGDDAAHVNLQTEGGVSLIMHAIIG